jgi:hypothetical protein
MTGIVPVLALILGVLYAPMNCSHWASPNRA